MSNLLFRALPIVKTPSHKELEANDFELVQFAKPVESIRFADLIVWYWEQVSQLTLLNQVKLENKRFQGGREEIFSIADVNKAIARAVSDLWNFQLRNVLSAITYFQQPTDITRFKIVPPVKGLTGCWTDTQLYQIETFVKFKCESCVGGLKTHFTAATEEITGVNLETPVLSTKAMIACLVNAFAVRDMATLNSIKVQPGDNGGVSRENTFYTAWKQVISPLSCLTVPARPDEQHSGLFLSQRQGLTVWHGCLTAPIVADATGYR